MDEKEEAVDLTALLAEGAEDFNRGAFWEAHEAWEAAWLDLKAREANEAAEALQGLILITAGFENLKRGKASGFSVQIAKGLNRLRRHRGTLGDLGVVDEAGFVEAILDVYLRAQAQRAALLDELEIEVPRLEVEDR